MSLVESFVVFFGLAIAGAPIGLAMMGSGFAYLFITHQDPGLVVDQVMNSLYGSYLLIAVPLFIFVANMMSGGGVLDRLFALAAAGLGRRRGGLAQANVATNLVFSGMSGSAVADAAGPGLVVARMMIASGGYTPGFAAATSAAAATIGPLVPPSIPMIFYALIANTSAAAMFLAGLVPALLMAGSMMTAIALLARRRDFPVMQDAPLMSAHVVLRALPALSLPVLLVGIIYAGVATPTEAAAVAAAYAVLLALVMEGASLAAIYRAIVESVRAIATVGLVIVGAFVFNYMVADAGLPQVLATALTAWHPAPLLFLAAVNLVFLALACVLDAITMLLVLVPLLVPLAVSLGIDPVQFGVVVILNMMIGLALPPHGLLLFVMHSLTGAPIGAIFREVMPLVASLLVVLAATTLIPAISLALPHALGY